MPRLPSLKLHCAVNTSGGDQLRPLSEWDVNYVQWVCMTAHGLMSAPDSVYDYMFVIAWRDFGETLRISHMYD